MLATIIEVGEETVHIQYLKGSYNRPWEPLHLPGIRGHPQLPWTDTLPKACILLANFVFDASKKVNAGTKPFFVSPTARLRRQTAKLTFRY